jgi:hypothetical protein
MQCHFRGNKKTAPNGILLEPVFYITSVCMAHALRFSDGRNGFAVSAR